MPIEGRNEEHLSGFEDGVLAAGVCKAGKPDQIWAFAINLKCMYKVVAWTHTAMVLNGNKYSNDRQVGR